MRPQIRLHDGEHWVISDADDPEQVLFRGTHRQCEDWLDQFEIRQRQLAQARTVPSGSHEHREHREQAAARPGATRDVPARGFLAWLKAMFCGEPVEASGKRPSSPRG